MQVLNILKRSIVVSVLFLAIFSALGVEARAIQPPELPYQTEWAMEWAVERNTWNEVGGDFFCSADDKGNSYVAGTTTGSLDGNANQGLNDAFLSKHGPDGTLLWTRQVGSSGDEFACGVAVDGAGNVYLAGFTNGALGGNTSAGMTDIFIIKYSASGAKLWTCQFGTESEDFGSGIAVDKSDNVYLTGFTKGCLGGNARTGGYDAFVVKVSASGITQWTRQIGTSVNDFTKGVAVDSACNVYIAGYTDGNLDGNIGHGLIDFFIVKYDTFGVKQWTRQNGTEDIDPAYSVAVTGSGDVYVTGHTYGEMNGASNPEWYDVYVVKYDTSGVEQWARQVGGPGDDLAFSAVVDNAGCVYVSGYTDTGLDGWPVSGITNIIVVKFDPNGTRMWVRQIWTDMLEIATSSALDKAGSLLVAGYKTGEGDTTNLFVKKFVPDPYSEINFPASGSYVNGADATVTGKSLASNGVSFVEVSTDGGASWQTASGTDSWSLALHLSASTTCNIVSRATDSLGNVQPPSPGVTVLTNKPLTIDSVTATPASPQTYGTGITWTTSASGGSGSYLYKYWRKGPDTGGVYIPQSDWDPSADWLWTPGAAQAGNNTIKAIVKNASGGATVQSAKSFSVTYPPIVIQAFGPTPVSPKPSGTLITWDTTVTGGSGSYLYCYYRKGPDTGGLYAPLQSWSASNTCGWTPGATQVGWNTIMVKVRNASGGAITQTAKGFKVQ